jgi:hypothetical protein
MNQPDPPAAGLPIPAIPAPIFALFRNERGPEIYPLVDQVAGRFSAAAFSQVAPLDERARNLSIKLHERRVPTVFVRSPATGGTPMWPVFNIVMRIVSSLIGVVMILAGTIWMLQGLNLAFRVGFMVGDYHWTIYGAILALVGIAEVVWSNRRHGNG